MIKYSLLVPTRGRIKSLEKLFESLEETTFNKAEVEILFAVDIDDVPTQQFLNIIHHQHLHQDFGNIQFFVRQRSEFTNRDYYNWLAGKSTGIYIWAVADDVVFLIKDWDKIITEKIESYLHDKPDRIMCAGIRDSTPKPRRDLPNFVCFPLVTKEAFNFFGYLLCSDLPVWGNDLAIYELYTKSNRYLPIRDSVYLDHVSWHTHSAIEDATAKNIRNIFRRYQHIPEHNVDNIRRTFIPREADRLISHLRFLKQKGI